MLVKHKEEVRDSTFDHPSFVTVLITAEIFVFLNLDLIGLDFLSRSTETFVFVLVLKRKVFRY